MPSFSKLPRDLITQISTNPRAIRFIENLQSQAFDLLPTTIQQIFAAIQDAQISADTAQTTAIQALNRPTPDVLGLVGVPVRADDVLGLVSVASQSDDALGVLAICPQS